MRNDFDDDMKIFLDIFFIGESQNFIGEKIVDFYIKHWSDKRSLPLFSKVVSCMGLTSMQSTIHSLIVNSERSGLKLTREHKKEIAISVLIDLSSKDNVDIDSYRKELIRSISGYYLTVEKMG